MAKLGHPRSTVMNQMFDLYGEVVPYVYHQCDWLEVGLRDSPVLPDGPTSPLISGLTMHKLLHGVSGKVVGHALPLSPGYSDIPRKLLPDVCTLCRLALGPPDAPLALQVDRRPGSVQEQRYANALTTMRSACVLSTTFTLTPYGSAAFLARGALARGAPGA